eukprot:4067420-Pyramimonas_sp.AAC.1
MVLDPERRAPPPTLAARVPRRTCQMHHDATLGFDVGSKQVSGAPLWPRALLVAFLWASGNSLGALRVPLQSLPRTQHGSRPTHVPRRAPGHSLCE